MEAFKAPDARFEGPAEIAALIDDLIRRNP